MGSIGVEAAADRLSLGQFVLHNFKFLCNFFFDTANLLLFYLGSSLELYKKSRRVTTTGITYGAKIRAEIRSVTTKPIVVNNSRGPTNLNLLLSVMENLN